MFNSRDKTIWCEYEGHSYIYYPEYNVNELVDDDNDPIKYEQILQGTWYIEN